MAFYLFWQQLQEGLNAIEDTGGFICFDPDAGGSNGQVIAFVTEVCIGGLIEGKLDSGGTGLDDRCFAAGDVQVRLQVGQGLTEGGLVLCFDGDSSGQMELALTLGNANRDGDNGN